MRPRTVSSPADTKSTKETAVSSRFASLPSSPKIGHIVGQGFTVPNPALLKHLEIERADFFGDSFGGTIAVMIAVRHPQLVRRLVSHGGSFTPYSGTGGRGNS